LDAYPATPQQPAEELDPRLPRHAAPSEVADRYDGDDDDDDPEPD